jgi:Na+/H+-dicarboxylate symporter
MKEKHQKEARNIAIALILGLCCGFIINFTDMQIIIKYLRPVGDIFIRLLKMVIIPLVLSSIFMSIINLKGPAQLGLMGKRVITYYFFTTATAVFLGILLVNLIQPGVGADLSAAGFEKLSPQLGNKIQENKGLFQVIIDVIIDTIPQNPINSMATGNILQIICFSLLLGIIALYNPEDSGPFITGMASLEKLSLSLTHLVMKFAPFGIFVLLLDVIGTGGLNTITSMGKYIITVLIGLTIHFIILCLLGMIRLKKSPFFILGSLKSTLMTAFSTSSSAATLPVAMANVEEELGVRKETAEFVLPLGATVNMDGTALYESVAAIFIAQAYGIDLTLGQQIVIFVTATISAIGAAAIPGAGLITMGIVLDAVGLPLEGIGLVLAVDRILDMFRTTVNVFGDCVGTIVVDSFSKSDSS